LSNKIKAVLWSQESEIDLKEIFEHYFKYNPANVTAIVSNIIIEIEKLIFKRQYQVDEYDDSCRRLLVNGKFRIVYTLINSIALITGVYPTKANPSKIRKTIQS